MYCVLYISFIFFAQEVILNGILWKFTFLWSATWVFRRKVCSEKSCLLYAVFHFSGRIVIVLTFYYYSRSYDHCCVPQEIIPYSDYTLPSLWHSQSSICEQRSMSPTLVMSWDFGVRAELNSCSINCVPWAGCFITESISSSVKWR